MRNSNTKKIGFIGTFVFHLLLLLICFFSSIGYTSIIPQEGVAIQYLPYEDAVVEEEIVIENEILPKESDNPKIVEDIIVDDAEVVEISEGQDSININEVEMAEAPVISSELEEALSKLNSISSTQSPISETKDSVQSLFSDNTIKDEFQDGYVLSDNRLAVKKIKPKYSCQESGKVIVRVWVNREGMTIKAEAGVRGTTESASCLLDEAKAAALKTTWTPYFNAPEVQIGQITYNFYQN
tara:strand:- start:128 stop:847 length:720 start_codon:yes stop_codon:yes gene_type:complete